MHIVILGFTGFRASFGVVLPIRLARKASFAFLIEPHLKNRVRFQHQQFQALQDGVVAMISECILSLAPARITARGKVLAKDLSFSQDRGRRSLQLQECLISCRAAIIRRRSERKCASNRRPSQPHVRLRRFTYSPRLFLSSKCCPRCFSYRPSVLLVEQYTNQWYNVSTYLQHCCSQSCKPTMNS